MYFTLNVKIDAKLLQLGSNDSLCIARKVNDGYTVIFQSASLELDGGQRRLLANNSFVWEDNYKVFLTTSKGQGEMISEATQSVDIKFGQLTTFSHDILQPATTPDASIWDTADGAGANASFAVDNVPNMLHTVLTQSVAGQFVPIYVDPNTHITSELIQVTPKNTFLCFWETHTNNNTIRAISKSKGFEWSFDAGSQIKNLRFGYSTPNQPASAEDSPAWYGT